MYTKDHLRLDLNALTDAEVAIMTTPFPWASDLPLGADGWVDHYYKKD